MSNVKQFLVIIFISIFMVGCGTTGNESLRSESEISIDQKITEGATTLAEIKAMFGSPLKTTFTDGGLEIWTYEFDNVKLTAASYLNPFGSTFKGTKKELVVLFDENEIVKRARMSESDVEEKYGMDSLK
tara:strand:- start:33 stop:422 length:390 start_codon:yes stop_codon:yes gene_type:complete